MQNFFVQIERNNGTIYLKIQATDREALLKNSLEIIGCPSSEIKMAVWVGSHEFEKFPASIIKTSGGLFKLVIDKVNGRYGAPMGRADVSDCPVLAVNTNGTTFYEHGKTFDRTVPLDGGGYDAGGAYWGVGSELRVNYNEDLTFVRFYRN
jgi:hypothetical protein